MQEVFKYEKLNYSHRIHNIQKNKNLKKYKFIFLNYFFEKKQEASRPDSSAV